MTGQSLQGAIRLAFLAVFVISGVSAAAVAQTTLGQTSNLTNVAVWLNETSTTTFGASSTHTYGPYGIGQATNIEGVSIAKVTASFAGPSNDVVLSNQEVWLNETGTSSNGAVWNVYGPYTVGQETNIQGMSIAKVTAAGPPTPPPTAPSGPNPYSSDYIGTYGGTRTYAMWTPLNATTTSTVGARTIGQFANFQTNDSYYSCWNGKTLPVLRFPLNNSKGLGNYYTIYGSGQGCPQMLLVIGNPCSQMTQVRAGQSLSCAGTAASASTGLYLKLNSVDSSGYAHFTIYVDGSVMYSQNLTAREGNAGGVGGVGNLSGTLYVYVDSTNYVNQSASMQLQFIPLSLFNATFGIAQQLGVSPSTTVMYLNNAPLSWADVDGATQAYLGYGPGWHIKITNGSETSYSYPTRIGNWTFQGIEASSTTCDTAQNGTFWASGSCSIIANYGTTSTPPPPPPTTTIPQTAGCTPYHAYMRIGNSTVCGPYTITLTSINSGGTCSNGVCVTGVIPIGANLSQSASFDIYYQGRVVANPTVYKGERYEWPGAVTLNLVLNGTTTYPTAYQTVSGSYASVYIYTTAAGANTTTTAPTTTTVAPTNSTNIPLCSDFEITSGISRTASGECNTGSQTTYHVRVDSGYSGWVGVDVYSASGSGIYDRASTAVCGGVQGTFTAAPDEDIFLSVRGGRGGGWCSGGVHAIMQGTANITMPVSQLHFGSPAIIVSNQTIKVGQATLLEANASGGSGPYTYIWLLGNTKVGTNSSTLVLQGNATTLRYSPDAISVNIQSGGYGIATSVPITVLPANTNRSTAFNPTMSEYTSEAYGVNWYNLIVWLYGSGGYAPYQISYMLEYPGSSTYTTVSTSNFTTPGLSSGSFSISQNQLPATGVYHARAYVVSGSGAGAYTNPVAFNVTSATGINSTNSTGSMGVALNVSTLRELPPSIDMRAFVNGGTGTYQYYFYVRGLNATSFGQPIYNSSFISYNQWGYSFFGTSVTPNLIPGYSYYGQVKVVDTHGDVAYSPVVLFTVPGTQPVGSFSPTLSVSRYLYTNDTPYYEILVNPSSGVQFPYNITYMLQYPGAPAYTDYPVGDITASSSGYQFAWWQLPAGTYHTRAYVVSGSGDATYTNNATFNVSSFTPPIIGCGVPTNAGLIVNTQQVGAWCGSYKVVLAALGQPNQQGQYPAVFDIYFNGALTNISTVFPGSHGTFDVDGFPLYVYVNSTTDGLYNYQQTALVFITGTPMSQNGGGFTQLPYTSSCGVMSGVPLGKYILCSNLKFVLVGMTTPNQTGVSLANIDVYYNGSTTPYDWFNLAPGQHTYALEGSTAFLVTVNQTSYSKLATDMEVQQFSGSANTTTTTVPLTTTIPYCNGFVVSTTSGLQNNGQCNTGGQTSYYARVDTGASGYLSTFAYYVNVSAPVFFNTNATASCSGMLGPFTVLPYHLISLVVNGGRGGGSCGGGTNVGLVAVNSSSTTTTVPTTTTAPSGPCTSAYAVTLYMNQSTTCSPFKIVLVNLGQPYQNGSAPADFDVYFDTASGYVLTNTTSILPGGSTVINLDWMPDGSSIELYVNSTFEGLYAYQRWAKVIVTPNPYGTTTTTPTTTISGTPLTVGIYPINTTSNPSIGIPTIVNMQGYAYGGNSSYVYSFYVRNASAASYGAPFYTYGPTTLESWGDHFYFNSTDPPLAVGHSYFGQIKVTSGGQSVYSGSQPFSIPSQQYNAGLTVATYNSTLAAIDMNASVVGGTPPYRYGFVVHNLTGLIILVPRYTSPWTGSQTWVDSFFYNSTPYNLVQGQTYDGAVLVTDSANHSVWGPVVQFTVPVHRAATTTQSTTTTSVASTTTIAYPSCANATISTTTSSTNTYTCNTGSQQLYSIYYYTGQAGAERVSITYANGTSAYSQSVGVSLCGGVLANVTLVRGANVNVMVKAGAGGGDCASTTVYARLLAP